MYLDFANDGRARLANKYNVRHGMDNFIINLFLFFNLNYFRKNMDNFQVFCYNKRKEKTAEHKRK